MGGRGACYSKGLGPREKVKKKDKKGNKATILLGVPYRGGIPEGGGFPPVKKETGFKSEQKKEEGKKNVLTDHNGKREKVRIVVVGKRDRVHEALQPTAKTGSSGEHK